MTKHELDEVLQRRLPSVRELFAAMAMQGLLSYGKITTSAEDYAGQAVLTADALLAELEKEMP